MFVKVLLICLLSRFIFTKETLNIAAFVTDAFEDKYCFKSAIEAAVKFINEDMSILPNHHLVIHFMDNFGLTGFGIKEFFKLSEGTIVYQAILGPFAEDHALPIRELAASLKLAQVEDVDETHHKRRAALLNLFHYFQWKRISLLYDYEKFHFIQAAENLNKALDVNGFTTLSVQGFSSRTNANGQMSTLKKLHARIISVDLDNFAAPMIFCDAFLKNMTLPKYLFISGNVGLNDYWHQRGSDDRCSRDQLREASEGFISLARSNFRLDGKLSRSGKTKEVIWEQIKQNKQKIWHKNTWLRKLTKNSKREFYEGSTRIFDLVYRTALAFDGLLKKDGKNVLMDSYHQNEKYEKIMKALKDVQFEGVTGQYFSNAKGEGNERDYIINQYRDGIFQKIGYFTSSTEQLTITNRSEIFKDNKIPRDQMIISTSIKHYSLTLVCAIWSVATGGIILSAVLLFINNYYRKRIILKISSPNINNSIIIGCMLCYTTVILYGVDTTHFDDSVIGDVCNTAVMTLSFGFTLSFGAMFSKTWRVYKIFSAAKRNKRVAVKDIQLYTIIAGLLVVDVILLTGFMLISPLKREQKQLMQKYHFESDILEVTVLQQCSCKRQTLVVACLLSDKGLLLLFGLFIAWETRNGTIPILNDSKYIGMAVYNVSFISIVGMICTSALRSVARVQEEYAVIALSICLTTTITLLLVFLPKVLLLFFRNEAARRRSVSSSSISSVSGVSQVQTQVEKLNDDIKTYTHEKVTIVNKTNSRKLRSVSFEEPISVSTKDVDNATESKPNSRKLRSVSFEEPISICKYEMVRKWCRK